MLFFAAATAQVPMTQEDLKLRRRVQPDFPFEAAVPSAACFARVWIGEDGRATRVQVRGCPAPFSDETHDAVGQWRWKPPQTAAGEPVEAVTSVRVNFALYPDTKVPEAGVCVWRVRIGPDGAVTTVGATPPDPCAAFFATRVSAPLTGACTLTLGSTDDPLPAGRCPAGATDAVAELLAASSLGRAERNVLEVSPAAPAP